MKNCAYYFFHDTINMKMNSVNLLCHIVLKINEYFDEINKNIYIYRESELNSWPDSSVG